MTPQRADDLVFVHSNLRLLLRNSIAGDKFGSLDEFLKLLIYL